MELYLNRDSGNSGRSRQGNPQQYRNGPRQGGYNQPQVNNPQQPRNYQQSNSQNPQQFHKRNNSYHPQQGQYNRQDRNNSEGRSNYNRPTSNHPQNHGGNQSSQQNNYPSNQRNNTGMQSQRGRQQGNKPYGQSGFRGNDSFQGGLGRQGQHNQYYQQAYGQNNERDVDGMMNEEGWKEGDPRGGYNATNFTNAPVRQPYVAPLPQYNQGQYKQEYEQNPYLPQQTIYQPIEQQRQGYNQYPNGQQGQPRPQRENNWNQGNSRGFRENQPRKQPYQGSRSQNYNRNDYSQRNQERARHQRQLTESDLGGMLTAKSQQIDSHPGVNIPPESASPASNTYIVSENLKPPIIDRRVSADAIKQGSHYHTFTLTNKMAPAGWLGFYKCTQKQGGRIDQVKGFQAATAINFNDLEQLGANLQAEIKSNFKLHFQQ